MHGQAPLVWIIDGDPGNGHLMGLVFRRMCGMRVVILNTAADVRDHLTGLPATQAPAFIVLNYHQPGLAALSDLIRPHLPETPTVLIVAHLPRAGLLEARAAGITDVLVSPIHASQFVHIAARYAGIDCSEG